MTLGAYLPIYRIRLRTFRLELSVPNNELYAWVADVAVKEGRRPDFIADDFPWSDASPVERGRSVALWFHSTLGRWSPENWTLPFGVFYNGRAIGVQELSGKDFAVSREVRTRTWTGRAYHGKGIGTAIHAMALDFAFAALAADWATTTTCDGDEASARIARKLGYELDGRELRVVQGVRRTDQRWQLSREGWGSCEEYLRHDTQIEGFDPSVEDVLHMFGIGEDDTEGRLGPGPGLSKTPIRPKARHSPVEQCAGPTLA